MADRNDKSDSAPDTPAAPWDKHFTKPDSADGMGTTLGEDVGAEHQRAEDARNGARDQGEINDDDLDR